MIVTHPAPKTDRTQLSKLQLIWNFLVGLVRDAWLSFCALSRWRRALSVAAILTFVAVVFVIDVPSIERLRQWSLAAGPWFIVLFFVVYVTITQFPIPRTILTLSSGVLFGPILGIALALGATTVSAALSLLIVRGLLGEWMRPRLKHPAVAGINRRLAARGWLAITSLRMIAAVPFSVLNYAAALSSVPLGAFVVATFIGSAPGTISTVLFGDAVAGGGNPAVIVVSVVLFVLGLSGLTIDSRLPVAR